MAKRAKITSQGQALLGSSSESTGQYYWIGYYALAYVPNEWKTSESVASEPTVSELTTQLTAHGDVIYNIWQGDLTGTGYANGNSDGSASGDLFGLTMYNVNLKKHYRYVLDENGNNTLVSWITDPSKTDGSMKGIHVYTGAYTENDTQYSSELPIPAPLYYLGDTSDKTNVSDYFDDSPTFEDVSYNGADTYPNMSVFLQTADALDIPRVSTDFRGYLSSDSTGSLSGSNGAYFDVSDIASLPDASAWFTAISTYTYNSGSSYIGKYVCDEFWKLHTISNYNRYHAPVSNIGQILNSDLYNKNMSKVTKFFPVSNYKVINSETKFTSNSQTTEVATAIRLGIDIDLSPNTLSSGFVSTDPTVLDQSSNEEFFNAYEAAYINESTDIQDQYSESIYTSTHTSFKFNRIGIYAVPMRTASYYSDDGFGVDEDKKLQFQINPDEEPVLFAVIDWDNTVVMSDTGDGIHEFVADFDVSLKSSADDNSTSIISDAAIFYNLYEDDAQTWYQHQLIANASSANAITELMLELNHLKKQQQISASGNCCPTPDLSKLYAPLNHSHKMLQNLKDSIIVSDGGLRGINALHEGAIVNGGKYSIGIDSVSLGYNTYVISDYATVTGGVGNYIGATSNEAFIGGGSGNNIHDISASSSIIDGVSSEINHSIRSVICGGDSNILSLVNNSVIGGGYLNKIHSNLTQSSALYIRDFIGCGESNEIFNSKLSSILNGKTNYISNSNFASILDGELNYILEASHNSLIGGGKNNKINGSTSSAICSGIDSLINYAINSFIGAGSALAILDGSYGSVICGGYSNKINKSSIKSFIGGGNKNTLTGGYSAINGGNENIINGNSAFIGGGWSNTVNCGFGSILGGRSNNLIATTLAYSAICTGVSNKEENSLYSFIGSGTINYILDSSYSSIIDGYGNKINKSTHSSILGGLDNIIDTNTMVCVFGKGITATRDNAFFVNSLSLYDSTIELVGKAPAINDVLRVSSTSGNIATVKWETMYPTFGDPHVIALASDNVVDSKYTINLATGNSYILRIETPVEVTLNDSDFIAGSTAIIQIVSVSDNSTIKFNGSSNTEETITLTSGKMYSFFVVNIYTTPAGVLISPLNHLTLIGDYTGR